MHAWQFERYGRYDEVLHWSQRPVPEPGPGEARMQVAAVSLNFPDLLICEGKYQVRAPLPAVPGCEAVGIVEAVGEGSRFRPGERVVGFAHGGGTLAEFALVDNETAWPVPDTIGDEQAAALSVTYGTAYYALVHRARIRPGETLLVTGAAGGVGTATLQLGKVLGATVIAAAGSAEKLEVCRRAGADHVIDYREGDFVEHLRALTDGRGADVIVDPVGGELFDHTKRCVAWEGRIVIVGFAGGHIPSIECNRVLLKQMSVVGLAWGEDLKHAPARGEACQRHLYDLLALGAIDPVICRTYPFQDVCDGFRLIESREVYGKVVIRR